MIAKNIWNMVLGLTFLFLPLILPQAALAIVSGSCQDYSIPLDPDGKVDMPHPVTVIRQKAGVYSKADSSEPVETLNFGKKMQVLQTEENRLEVTKGIGTQEALGWVERSDLLCVQSPLQDKDTGLEKQLYINTETEMRGGNAKTVSVSLSPDSLECAGEKCRELSRFTGYFVFDEREDCQIGSPDETGESGRCYLLGENFRLELTEPLVGWIDADKGILWNTAFGMRPREELVFPEGHEKAGQERAVCAYKSLDDAVNDQECQPILGGKRWYSYPLRIPVLDRVSRDEQDFYKVAAPFAATGASHEENGETINLDPKALDENKGIDSLLDRKHVDVLFLIDGSKSILPYLQLIRDSVDRIMQSLIEHEEFQETQFRFGIRIYRDTYAKELELGEGAPPSANECALSKPEQKDHIQKFKQNIDAIIEAQGRRMNDPKWRKEENNDDYPENLYGGLKQALTDLTSVCPDYTKVLFVIGDCGYDVEVQKKRGVAPISIADLVPKFKGELESGTTNIVTFFLQTPENSRDIAKPAEYKKAYNLFSTQARSLLREILPQSAPDNIDDYFMPISDKQLIQNIIKGIKNFGDPSVINELILDLRGGSALVEAIGRLQKSDRYLNLPGLFWEIVRQGSCQKLGTQCQERVYDTILEGYIPISDEVVEDVWLSSNDLNSWTLILNSIGNMANVSGSELRETFTSALVNSLEKIVRKPLYQETGEPLEKYIQRKGGLPVREQSPLFQYSIEELENSQVVPNCELSRMVTWLYNVTEMLSIVKRGDIQPVYTKRPFPGECPSGQQIPFIDGAINHKPLGNDMRYDHIFKKVHMYWVPKEYLP